MATEQMEKVYEAVLLIGSFLAHKKKDKKIIVALTGGYATGKTTIGKLLEKTDKNIVFVPSDFFRLEVPLKGKKNIYKKFISSYKRSLIESEIESFLKDEDASFNCKRSGIASKRTFLNRSKKILLLESTFIFDKYFDTLPLDYIIELASYKKDIDKRRRLRNENAKAVGIDFERLLDTYNEAKKKSKRMPDIAILN